MKRYDELISEGRSSLLSDLARIWFKDSETSHFRTSANFVASVKSDGEGYFLRFNHKSERTKGHVVGELTYLKHLQSKGVNVNQPVPSLSGDLLETIDTDLGVVHAVMFKAIPGTHIDSESLSDVGFRRWGKALAGVHNASTGLELLDVPSWKDHVAMIKSICSDKSVITQIEEISAFLSSINPSESYGVVPYDFEMDNIKWLNGVPGFIDFDDYCLHWYSADIAYALRDIYGDKVSNYTPHDPRFRSFIEGYRWVRSIPVSQLDLIPVFIRLHNIHVIAGITRALDDDCELADPSWAADLRTKLVSKRESILSDVRENPVVIPSPS